MGWTFTHREKGISNKEWFAREYDGDRGYEVLDVASGSLNRNHVYIALKLPDGKVLAVACLTRWVPKDEYNYGWKDMSEDMGPNICDCPQRIIDLLSPIEELFPNEESSSREWAQAWRDRVATFRERMNNRLKLRDDMLVTVPYDLQFSNFTMEAETPFRVDDAKKKLFSRGYNRFKLRRDTMIDLQELPAEASILA